MNKNIMYLFNIILGLLLVFDTIYKRLIITRLPKDLWLIQDGIFLKGLSIFVFLSIFISAYLCVNNLLFLCGKEHGEGFISRLSGKLNDVIDNALQEIYILVGNFLTKEPYDKVSFFSEMFYKYFHKTTEAFFLFILYFIRIIILLCFLIDVFIFFRLNYMYKSLYLLCFSMIIKIIFYMLKDFSGNLEETKSVLNINDKGMAPHTELPRTTFSLKEEYKDLDLVYHVGQFILCSKIKGYLEIYDRFTKLFNPYFNTFVYFLYFGGWFFVLFKNLFYA